MTVNPVYLLPFVDAADTAVRQFAQDLKKSNEKYAFMAADDFTPDRLSQLLQVFATILQLPTHYHLHHYVSMIRQQYDELRTLKTKYDRQKKVH